VNRFGLQLVTRSVLEAVTLAEAKAHLYIDVQDHDAELANKITEACAVAERECGRQFCEATWRMVLDDFPANRWPNSDCGDYKTADAEIELPLSPLRSVSSVKYYSAAGVLTTISASEYWVATGGEPGRIVPKAGFWPSVESGRPEAVEIEFVAGWPSPAAVPADLKGAIKLILADLWENRGDTIATGVPSADRQIHPTALRVLNSYRAHLLG
jgi:uncharacterized phiE125 gp8 family phage protein